MSLSRITSASIANSAISAVDIADGTITAAKIISVANTQITGNIVSSQIVSVANTQITGNIVSSQIAPDQTLNGNVSVTGVTTLTGGLNAALPVLSGGTGVTTKTGTGAVVLGTAPTITGATITVAATAAPAFSAIKSGNQTVSANTATKVTFQTEEFDTNSNFDNTTNFRFTPTVAGYYQVSGAFQQGGTGEVQILLYKNGSAFKNGNWINATTVYSPIFSVLVSMNGSTDYIEMYAYTGATGTTIYSGNSCYFQASMVRSA